MNVFYLLENSAAKNPDRMAVISGDTRLTFRHLNERTNRLAHSMRAHGVKKGDRVALMSFNTHHFAEIYFATIKLGALLTPVNFRFVREEIEYIVNHSGATFFFFAKEFQDRVSEVYERLPRVTSFITPEAPKGGYALDYETFLSTGNSDEPKIEVKENDPCQIMYTSGTTGRPKGAVITHGNVLWNLTNTILGREEQPGEISLIIGPLYHTAGLNNHFTLQIALGGTSILVRSFEPEEVLRYIEKERVNVISGSPAMYNLLLQYPDLYRFDTQSVTKCTAGSAILPHDLKVRLLELFPKANGVYDVYGCTEASPSIAILKAKDSLRKHGSVGPSLPFLQTRIVDKGGNPLPLNQVGELICKGPNVMKEYYKDREATADTIRDGWLHTGDLATMDEEGFIYIVDRKKDMIISGGENIYPRELEEVLFRHPAITDVAIVGIPDSTWGETVKAFIVLKQGENMEAQEVIDFCTQHLASYKKPRAVEFIDEIPKNPSGKPLKRLLRKKGKEM